MLNVGTGRFLSEDPKGFAANGNGDLYEYAGNGPTDGSDPSGDWLIINKSQKNIWQKMAGQDVQFAPLGEDQLIVVAKRNATTHQMITNELKQRGVNEDLIPSVMIALYGGAIGAPLNVSGDLQDYAGGNHNMLLSLASDNSQFSWSRPTYDPLTRMSAGYGVMELDQFDKSDPRAAQTQAVKNYLLGNTPVIPADVSLGYNQPAGEHLGVVMLNSRSKSGLPQGYVIHGIELSNPLAEQWDRQQVTSLKMTTFESLPWSGNPYPKTIRIPQSIQLEGIAPLASNSLLTVNNRVAMMRAKSEVTAIKADEQLYGMLPGGLSAINAADTIEQFENGDDDAWWGVALAPPLFLVDVLQGVSYYRGIKGLLVRKPTMPMVQAQAAQANAVLNRFIAPKNAVAAEKGAVKEANFAQSSIRKNEAFSKEGAAKYSELAGRPINNVDDLVAAIKDGKINPSQLPVDYVVTADGTKLILNTRTSVALDRA
jgi:hypothetical protein